MKKKSLWKKYFTLYVTCLTGITMLVMSFFLIKIYTENKDMTEKNAQNSIYFADLNLSGKMKLIEERFGGMDLASKFKEAGSVTGYTDEKKSLVESLYAEYNDVLSVFYVDSYGVNYSAGEPMGALSARADYIERAQNSEEFKKRGIKWFFATTQNGYNACVLYRKIIKVDSSCKREFFGDILIYIDTERINDNYFRNIENDTGMLFVDSDNIITIASDNELVGKKFDDCFEERNGKIYNRNGQAYHYCKEKSNINGWHNICYYKTGISFSKMWKFGWIVVPFILIIFAVAFYISYYFSRKFGRPLENLIEHIAVTENGDVVFGEETVSAEDDEVIMLKRVFDDMLDKLKLQAELNFQKEINVKNALIKAYESQMNPHFLYNTLQIIQMLSVMGKNEEISDITTCLGKLLRFNLSEESETTLGAEIENIKNYFKILKYRFGEDFSYKIIADDGLMNCRAIKFMLQPFVENSVSHGFSDKMNSYEIAVVITKLNNELAIVIRDNGSGINPTKLAEIKDSLKGNSEDIGIGISNVNKRIKLIYGERFGVDIFSCEKNTHVVIHIPYNE